jgi:hypothetical protein
LSILQTVGMAEEGGPWLGVFLWPSGLAADSGWQSLLSFPAALRHPIVDLCDEQPEQ